MIFSTRCNGKLLLTGEYFVTEGATALAVPTQLGQQLHVSDGKESGILKWESFDHENNCWFEARLKLEDFSLADSNRPDDEKVLCQLQDILREMRQLNPLFLKDHQQGIEVKTVLEFPRNWGLGSSSTLISMLAQWAKVDPYTLLENTFKGSGYDIAAATAKGPILFRRFNGKPQSEPIGFNPKFTQQLYFVHLNQKQNSREAMVHYMVTAPEIREVPLPRISQITFNIAQYTQNLEDFEELVMEHEGLVKTIVQQVPVKERYFNEFWGSVKSLGAWGGDFVMVSSNRSEEETRNYFVSKGFSTILRYDEMVLNKE